MKYLVFFAVLGVLACTQAAPVAENVQAEIAQADPRNVLSSSAHHIPDDDPLVSIFVDILHDGDGEYEPEPYEGEQKAEIEQSPKEQMRKRRVLAVDDETEVPEEEEDERDNRIGKFVNIHVGIDNRGNGNGDGLVNLPM